MGSERREQLEITPEEQERFDNLYKRWHEETVFHSSVRVIMEHQCFQEIVGMGERAIPLILDKLQQKPGHIFTALRLITKQEVVPPGSNINGAIEAWIEWGKQEGYV